MPQPSKHRLLFWASTLPFVFSSCITPTCPFSGGLTCDELIEPDETHFAHLWKITSGGENAEGYWSFAGDRLTLQRRNTEEGVDCDQIYLTDARGGALELVSTGTGKTTCSYFLPGDREVIFASTHASMTSCPPPPDFREGYVWMVHPEFDLWVRDLRSGALSSFLPAAGYDAEATVSPRGDRLVFTSTRSGDLELWTAGLDGSELRQITFDPGYDGGAFFSHDGSKLVYRSTKFTPGREEAELATYRALLAEWKVRPQAMELVISDSDGANRRWLTQLGGANFAPFFYPDDQRVIFSTNHHDLDAGQRSDSATPLNFDLFAIDANGAPGSLERITTYPGFDSFPMFSPCGRFLVFASNRGGRVAGETNLFVAQWK